MATITVTIKDSANNVLGSFTSEKTDEEVQMALGLFAARRGYQATVLDAEGTEIPNPESIGDFMIRKMKEFAEAEILAQAITVAQDAAKAQVLSSPFNF